MNQLTRKRFTRNIIRLLVVSREKNRYEVDRYNYSFIFEPKMYLHTITFQMELLAVKQYKDADIYS